LKKAKQRKKRVAVGDLVFMSNIGMCRIEELYPDAKDNEFNSIVRDALGILWASNVEQIVPEGPTLAWICQRRARQRSRTARGKHCYRDCLRN
jgi:hypothetical protein